MFFALTKIQISLLTQNANALHISRKATQMKSGGSKVIGLLQIDAGIDKDLDDFSVSFVGRPVQRCVTIDISSIKKQRFEVSIEILHVHCQLTNDAKLPCPTSKQQK